MSMFKNPNELEINSTVKLLVYGQPGIGKTTLALSAPNPVLFDFDGGISRVNKAHQCPTLQVKSWDEALAALDELEKGVVDCKTIVIDTGVALDSAVYMLIMALAVAGFVALKIRRREDY